MCLWLAKNRRKYARLSGQRVTGRFPAIFKNALVGIQSGIYRVIASRC